MVCVCVCVVSGVGGILNFSFFSAGQRESRTCQGSDPGLVQPADEPGQGAAERRSDTVYNCTQTLKSAKRPSAGQV